jgi:hypothetical protein
MMQGVHLLSLPTTNPEPEMFSVFWLLLLCFHAKPLSGSGSLTKKQKRIKEVKSLVFDLCFLNLFFEPLVGAFDNAIETSTCVGTVECWCGW